MSDQIRMSRRPARRLFSLLPVALAVVLGGFFALSEPEFNGQRVTIESYDATWDDIRVGRYKAKPIVISGWLSMPSVDVAKVPAVVLIHGSDGPGPHQSEYARLLVRAGFAVLIIDSFGPRGVEDTIGRQQLVSSYTMTVDAFQALAFLSRHPRIDGRRISVVGWSKGGTVALNAARLWFQARLAHGLQRFANHVAYYPWCGERMPTIRLTGAPVLLFVGGKDDWSGADACTAFARRARFEKHKVELVEYPDAAHGFDYSGSFRRHLTDARDMRRCDYLFAPDRLTAVSTGRTYAWSDFDVYLKSCSSKGAHVATNPSARADSRRRLIDFLVRREKSKKQEDVVQEGRRILFGK